MSNENFVVSGPINGQITLQNYGIPEKGKSI